MILEPNVPKSVQNWARCLVIIRNAESDIKQLTSGSLLDLCQYWQVRRMGRESFKRKVREPGLRRLERLCRRCRALAQAIESHDDPRRYMLERTEMLEMIGSTLHCVLRCGERFLTLERCSLDGERLYNRELRATKTNSLRDNGISAIDPAIELNALSDGIDALDLLSLGFGRTRP